MGGGIKGCHYSDFPGIWDNVKKYQTIIKNLIQISDNSTIYVDKRDYQYGTQVPASFFRHDQLREL